MKMTKWIWIAVILACGGICDAGGAEISEDQARKAIETFLGDPLSEKGREAWEVVNRFSKESDKVDVEVAPQTVPWIAPSAAGHKGERNILAFAFIAGNILGQLDRGEAENDVRSGLLAAFAVYDLMRKDAQAKGEAFEIREIEPLLTLHKEGKLAAWVKETGERMSTSRRGKEIRIRRGDSVLSGILVLPAGKGPHPAVVFVHGSGPVDRSGSGVYPRFWKPFVEAGFACLSWDKPGCGKSTGDWTKQTFEDRAREAVAGVEFLKGRKEIDAKRIGLWGGSQGGWIGPFAATLSGDVAFVISVSGPGTPTMETERYRIESELRAEKVSEEVIRKVLDLFDRGADLARKKAPFEEVEKLYKEAEGEPWYAAAVGPAGKITPQVYEFHKLNIDYDPAPILERVKCPILAIWGELDCNVPAAKSREIFERCLKKAGNPDVTLKIFPKADHGIFPSETGSTREMMQNLARGQDFAPGFLDAMTGWLRERFLSPTEGVPHGDGHRPEKEPSDR